MVKAKITTIIPTFQRPHLIPRAISSCLKQVYSNIEVHVFDNHSEDSTEKVVREISKSDSRVKYFQRERNIGVRANVNEAIKSVKTPYFSILSDDNVLMPNFYEMGINSFGEYPDIAFFAGKGIVQVPQGSLKFSMPSQWKSRGFLKVPSGIKQMVSGPLSNHLVLDSIIFKTELCRETCEFYLQEGLLSDILYILHLASKYPIFFLNENVSIYSLKEKPDPGFIKKDPQAWAQTYKIFKADFLGSIGIKPKILEMFRLQVLGFYETLIKDFNQKRKGQDVEELVNQLSKEFRKIT